MSADAEQAGSGMSVRRDGHTVALAAPSRSEPEAEVTVQTDHMSDLKEPKAVLRHYLQSNRDALLWKLDGLGERDLRMPCAPPDTDHNIKLLDTCRIRDAPSSAWARTKSGRCGRSSAAQTRHGAWAQLTNSAPLEARGVLRVLDRLAGGTS
jgi:Protein of unknown function (DUF664)